MVAGNDSISQTTLVIRDDSKRRNPAPVLYKARYQVPGVISNTADYNEMARQYESRWKAHVEAACWDRYLVNYDSWCTEAEDEGSTAEHIKVLRAIVGELGEQGWLAVYQRELVEHNPAFEPPTNRISTTEAFREMLDRRMTELWGPITQCRETEGFVFTDRDEDYENAHPFGRWPLGILDRCPTSYGSWGNGVRPFSPRDFSNEEIREALLARRWPLRSYEALLRAHGAEQEQLALPPGLADQLATLTRGGDWLGTISDLHQALKRAGHVMALVHELTEIRPDLLALGVVMEKTGRRIGRGRQQEWRISSQPANQPTIES